MSVRKSVSTYDLFITSVENSEPVEIEIGEGCQILKGLLRLYLERILYWVLKEKYKALVEYGMADATNFWK